MSEKNLNSREKKLKGLAREKLGTTGRADWDTNHVAIKKAIYDFISKNGHSPSLRNIADVTGLSTTSIANHWAKIDLSELYPAYNKKASEVIDAMAKQGSKGNPNAAKLFLEVVDKFTPKQKLNIEEQVDYSNVSDEILEEFIRQATER